MRNKTGVLLGVMAAGALYGAFRFSGFADWMDQNERVAPIPQAPAASLSLLRFPGPGATDLDADRGTPSDTAPARAATPLAPASLASSGSGAESRKKAAAAALEDIFADLRRREPVYAGQVRDYLGVSRETISLEDLQTKAVLLLERRRRLYENPEATGRVIEGFLQASRDLPSLDAERGMALGILVSLPAGDRPGLRAEITTDVRSAIAARTQDPSYYPQAIRAYIQNSGARAENVKEAFLAAIGPIEDPAVNAEIDEVFKQTAAR
jgi:hypothetical protein